jgi:hypothetical protein
VGAVRRPPQHCEAVREGDYRSVFRFFVGDDALIVPANALVDQHARVGAAEVPGIAACACRGGLPIGNRYRVRSHGTRTSRMGVDRRAELDRIGVDDVEVILARIIIRARTDEVISLAGGSCAQCSRSPAAVCREHHSELRKCGERELRNRGKKSNLPRFLVPNGCESPRIAGICARFRLKFERDGTEWLSDQDSNLHWQNQFFLSSASPFVANRNR